ncbi:Gp19/Gp15/Gp42 family protein [Cellulomonas denverensis]|uniref:Gp19/Gp15/Gp42 family protein n=1 Tax=Cellulomonas denverensis TaxID=264297 RepID=UPI0035E533A0
MNAWLSDIEALILSRIPDLAAQIADGHPTEAVVKMVEANAVIRKIKNPDGKQNERIDDYSFGLNTDAARGDLFLTDEEWAAGAWLRRGRLHHPAVRRGPRRGQWVHPDVGTGAVTAASAVRSGREAARRQMIDLCQVSREDPDAPVDELTGERARMVVYRQVTDV